ncbi:DEAD/DEAH box helicase [Pedobacter duraquae]|uniref:SNF2 family DNA or RNA helicase n=1 Tax=Pedobacter duraquae TaxID=425511 RepID=A0A4R6II26_9SPHI|nr:DEAD/DEAH box helicase [Pedobacter duraquae]TDO21587.1 SNF2 family DNA or RNA helicase [Pedobacter duraquae]
MSEINNIIREIKELGSGLSVGASRVSDVNAWKAPVSSGAEEGRKRIIVIRKHRYYTHFYAELYEAEETAAGKLKSPLVLIDPLSFIWKIDDPDVLKFYTALARFRNSYDADHADSDQESLAALVKNPLRLEAYYHDPEISSTIGPKALVPVELKFLKQELKLNVDQKEEFYELTGKLYINEKGYDLDLLNIKFHYFVLYNGVMQLIADPDFIKVILFFKKHNNRIIIPTMEFDDFQRTTLSKIGNSIRINYSFLKRATARQLKENNFDSLNAKLLYLSDSGDYILITPVLRYGNVEVPVMSQQQIYAIDASGKPFTVHRDEQEEYAFTGLILRQHPFFEEQLDQEFFYLHRKRFLESGWFLEAFDIWQKNGISILGFNQLTNNKLNPNKAKISIAVLSGLDWFETDIDLKFGKQKVTLKYLHKALRNKSKFVELGDGTQGILPEEWIRKFNAYFSAGELQDEKILTSKANFATVAELYEAEMLSKELQLELEAFKARINDFSQIISVEVPQAFIGQLRDYQKQGLDWLNFLDEFGFGGCLADDMGLGKTIQIIAFILLQKEQAKPNANLVVVPSTLLFNWQAELAKFAPSLRIFEFYGTERNKKDISFDQFDVVLTTYGTLLSEIGMLKTYKFNYVFFDESQVLKNPLTQRYKAAALLKSVRKIVLTGTPIENNTFDLYGQLSLACPGLLGTKQFFKEQYVMPIDRFKDTRKAQELQKKIAPFILRRTKTQVASELPDKTEMILYCEMGAEQRKVYDAYKLEYRNFLMGQREEDLSRQSMHILKGMTILRQICNSPALVKDDVFYGESSSKIDVLLEEIENRSATHKILVFSQFVTMLDLIRTELERREIPFQYLTGQTRKRAEEVAGFRENEETRVFLISLKVGGTGLNLVEADYVYLIDPWWNPAVENQAIDRCYRIGQDKHVVAVRLICPGTIEEKMMILQDAKRSLVEDLIKTDGNMLKTLSKTELLDLFS